MLGLPFDLLKIHQFTDGRVSENMMAAGHAQQLEAETLD